MPTPTATVSLNKLLKAARQGRPITVTDHDGKEIRLNVTIHDTPKRQRSVEIANTIAAPHGVRFIKNPANRKQLAVEYDGQLALASILSPRKVEPGYFEFSVQKREPGPRVYVFLLMKDDDDTTPDAIVMDNYELARIRRLHGTGEEQEVYVGIHVEDGRCWEEYADSPETELKANVNAFDYVVDELMNAPRF